MTGAEAAGAKVVAASVTGAWCALNVESVKRQASCDGRLHEWVANGLHEGGMTTQRVAAER